MARTGGKKGMPHLFSGLVASSLATAVLFAGQMVAIHLEHTTLPSTAPELFPLKNEGLAFQRAGACAECTAALRHIGINNPFGSGEGEPFFSQCANRFSSLAHWWWRREPTGHVAKSRRTRLGLAWQKTRHLAFTRLVLESQVRAEGLRGKFFAYGSEQNDIRDRAGFRAEAGPRFTDA
jgi:hypothetical protein